MANKPIVELRDALQAFAKSNIADIPHIPTLADAFYAANHEIADAAIADLRHMALVKLANDVMARRVRKSDPSQGDLFSIGRPEAIRVPVFKGKKITGWTRKSFDQATVRQVRAKIARAQNPAKSGADKGIEEILTRIAPHIASEDMTMAEAMAAADAAEKNKALANV